MDCGIKRLGSIRHARFQDSSCSRRPGGSRRLAGDTCKRREAERPRRRCSEIRESRFRPQHRRVRLALQNYCGAGLRICGFAQHDQAASGSVGRLPESEPCCQRNSMACSMAASARSRTMAANPPACNSRSVARIAWSSRVQGFSFAQVLFINAGEGFSTGTLRHRTQSRCFRLTPFAAADSGSSDRSRRSTRIHFRPGALCQKSQCHARTSRGCWPGNSLMAPTGKPPSSNSSICAIPVATTSRIVREAGVSTEGSDARSRSRSVGGVRQRKAWREGIFAFCSPLDSGN